MEFYLSLAGAIMGALSLVLHAIGQKSPKAEAYAEDVDKVAAMVKPMLPEPPAAK